MTANGKYSIDKIYTLQKTHPIFLYTKHAMGLL